MKSGSVLLVYKGRMHVWIRNREIPVLFTVPLTNTLFSRYVECNVYIRVSTLNVSSTDEHIIILVNSYPLLCCAFGELAQIVTNFQSTMMMT